ncbi:MAG: hypothetical protein BGO43_13540 [Gammaproteobacteria bacterium 39-13]|nr:hypothetical protein [Gammaproteobacteria bacterium]OJV94769.1 MAG: hypothetical protein BGO43_13540 [Gammaproteobacteria bacterium 39-13]
MHHKPQEVIKLLIKKGYTEQWIASKASISQSTINRIKEGRTQYPRCNTADNIQKIYLKYIDKSN